jgi:transposase
MTDDVMGSGAAADDDRTAAYKDAAIAVAKGIALGAVPFLGQAIDAYDTVESCLSLYNSETPDAKEDAEFDLVLALVGWIPGPGDGVKKSLRLVNRDPQRFAPVLFDLLRFILSECGIKTSPEMLLEQMFDSSALAAEIDEVITGVKGSSTFKALPNWTKIAVTTVLADARDNMPRMMGVVEKRLLKWKKVQRNSSATSNGSERPATVKKPGGRDAQVGTEGHDGAIRTHSNQSDKSTLRELAISELTNEGLGVSGEHIADYICAEEFGWGKDWDGHDRGAEGVWLEGRPSEVIIGKLSKGGYPKMPNILYKLTDPANGTGIDAVWRATSSSNNGKRYAIVEAKASKHEDAPKFHRKISSTRKPSITSKLGVNGLANISSILEPVLPDDDSDSGQNIPYSKTKQGGRIRGGATTSKSPLRPENSLIYVQMSVEWINKNINASVSRGLRRDVMSSYSRHLFYAPLYHISGSPKQHALAKLAGRGVTHDKHDAFHYGEEEVKRATNKKKNTLIRKYGTRSTLALEV